MKWSAPWERVTFHRHHVVVLGCFLGLLTLLPDCGGGTPSRLLTGRLICGFDRTPVPPASVPTDVARWAQNAPVIGGGSLWTVKSALNVHPVFQGGTWSLKFPWYLRPPGIPIITGDQPGVRGGFRSDATQATDLTGTWVASVLHFSTPGCWRVTSRYMASVLTVEITAPG